MQTYDLDYHLQQTSEPLRTAFLTLRDKVLALDGVEERVNQKSQITYRTTKSFLACGFGKRRITVQLKGVPSHPTWQESRSRTFEADSGVTPASAISKSQARWTACLRLSCRRTRMSNSETPRRTSPRRRG